MKVVVTQEHIDKGVKGEHADCPIALAVKALGYKNVSVDAESIDASDGVGGASFFGYLPDEAALFIGMFDNGEDEVAPFTFEPDESEERRG